MFNFSTAFDHLFQKVVTEFEDSFSGAVIREKSVVNPDTGTVRQQRTSVAFEKMNWINPEHKQQYTIDGRLFVTDAVFLCTPTTDVRQGDTILNLDSGDAYDVLGIKDFTSHREVHTCFQEMGFNNGVVDSGRNSVLNTAIVV